jgi:hypothetical protein
MSFSKKHLLLIAPLLFSTLAKANTNGYFPHLARVSTSGMISSDAKTIGGDGMLPIYGNQQGFAFGDFMADYGNNNTYLLSPGVGYRGIVNNQILGGYFFSDYEKTSLGTNFWVLNPGVEWMSSHWDARVNGYFPTETSKQSGAQDYASNYGNYSAVSFETGTHNQYGAAGLIAINQGSNNALIINANNSSFDNNGTLSGSGANILIRADNPSLGASENAAAAAGVFSFNDSSSEGSVNINATHSTFDNNGTLSGDNTVIQSVNDNGFGTGSGELASTSDITGYNIALGDLTINATNSEFNNNGTRTMGYGIYAYTPDITGTTLVNYTGATFGGTPQINTNQGISDGTTQWIS